MASTNRYHGIDPRIVRCVRHHAARAAAALPGMDVEDVEQELMLHVHRRLWRFDAARGSLRTFVDRIARNFAANLIHAARSERRGSGVEFISFDPIAWKSSDDERACSDERVSARELYVGYAPEDLLNLRIELWRVFDRLPPPLRSCFLGLLDNTAADAARRTGVSRSTLYERIATIRESVRAADLHLHLAVSDTFEVFPVSEQ